MIKVISEIKNLILIKRFKEGLEVYFCRTCKHTIHKPVFKLLKNFHCQYCGQGV
jgi:DNA-directed RNA polymerase subunit RPC12/RpoP